MGPSDPRSILRDPVPEIRGKAKAGMPFTTCARRGADARPHVHISALHPHHPRGHAPLAAWRHPVHIVRRDRETGGMRVTPGREEQWKLRRDPVPSEVERFHGRAEPGH